MTRCPVSEAELENDRKTSFTGQDEEVIKGYKDQAFLEILQDDNLISDTLVDLTTVVIQMISESRDCNPLDRSKNPHNIINQEDVVSNAHTWQCLVDLVKSERSDDIEKKAKELWEDMQ